MLVEARPEPQGVDLKPKPPPPHHSPSPAQSSPLGVQAQGLTCSLPKLVTPGALLQLPGQLPPSRQPLQQAPTLPTSPHAQA